MNILKLFFRVLVSSSVYNVFDVKNYKNGVYNVFDVKKGAHFVKALQNGSFLLGVGELLLTNISKKVSISLVTLHIRCTPDSQRMGYKSTTY